MKVIQILALATAMTAMAAGQNTAGTAAAKPSPSPSPLVSATKKSDAKTGSAKTSANAGKTAASTAATAKAPPTASKTAPTATTAPPARGASGPTKTLAANARTQAGSSSPQNAKPSSTQPSSPSGVKAQASPAAAAKSPSLAPSSTKGATASKGAAAVPQKQSVATGTLTSKTKGGAAAGTTVMPAGKSTAKAVSLTSPAGHKGAVSAKTTAKTNKPLIAVKTLPSSSASAATTTATAAVPESKPSTRMIGANGRRDPFVSPIRTVGSFGPGPGCTGGKRCLSIPELVLRGTVKDISGKMMAVVANSAHSTYTLRENDQVFNGSVEKITTDSIVFREFVRDALGHESAREVVKKLGPIT
jgi:Tfp pilus assembly protein PilP